MGDKENTHFPAEQRFDAVILILFLTLSAIVIAVGITQRGLIALGDPYFTTSASYADPQSLQEFYAYAGIMTVLATVIVGLILTSRFLVIKSHPQNR